MYSYSRVSILAYPYARSVLVIGISAEGCVGDDRIIGYSSSG